MVFRNEVQQLNCSSNGTKLLTELIKHGMVLILIANLSIELEEEWNEMLNKKRQNHVTLV